MLCTTGVTQLSSFGLNWFTLFRFSGHKGNALVKIRFLLALNASLLPDPYYLDILYSMYTNYMYVQQIGAALATL